MASTSQSQPNGVSSSAPGPSQSASQPTQNTTTSGSATVQNTQATGASSGTAGSSNTAQAGAPGAPQPPASPAPTHAPRPRDARTIELLLTSQGVTSFDQRVPLLLLDFAYRHTSSVLSDAIHLSTDPYTSHAGAKPSASSGAAPSAPSTHDAVITTSAINTAIASRQAFQFRGGAGGVVGGGGASKDWLQELARERNKVALPRIPANEWGMRLPNERFVLSGTGWGLRDEWGGDGGEDEEEDSDEDMEIGDASQKKDAANATTEGAQEEGGGLDELLGDDMVDEDMEGME